MRYFELSRLTSG